MISNYIHSFFRIAALVVAMLLLWIVPLSAQYGSLYKKPIYLFDMPNSIEGNEVQDIYQDKAGYMWFASKAGLVRYNGRDFKVYSHNITDSTTISSNSVELILETRNGDFWVATWGGGLNKMDRKSGQFTRYQTSNSDLSNDFISSLVEDENGQLWIATRNGLNRLDLQTEQFKVFLPEAGNEQSLSHTEVRSLCLDQQQTLWIGTGYPWEDNLAGGLNKYDPRTESFTRYTVKNSGLQNNKVSAIFEDSKHNFWIGTGDNKIYLMDRSTGGFRCLEELSSFEIRRDSAAYIRSFFEADDGSIWISSYGSGMRNYDLEKDIIKDRVFNTNKEGNFFYPLNHAWKIYRSRDGVLWVCTGDIGDNVFKSNAILPNAGIVNSSDDIVSVHVNPQTNYIWAGRLLNGVYRDNWDSPLPGRTWFDDPAEDYRGTWSFQDNTQANKLFDNIFTMQEDHQGALWFAKFDEAKGLYRFHPATQQIQRFRHNPDRQNSLADDVVVDIVVTSDRRELWLVTADGTLHHVDGFTFEITRYNKTTHANYPQGVNILELSEDGTLWLGGVHPEGKMHLSTFDAKTHTLVNYPLVDLPPQEAANPLTGIVSDSKNNIWLISDSHIAHLKADRTVKVYPISAEEYGRIVSVLPDEDGHLWMATSIGITVFDPEEGSLYNYPSAYEINALPFKLRSAAIQTSGELLFCGRGGCTYINEDTRNNYKNNTHNPNSIVASQVLYTNFLLNGQEIKTGPYAIDSILVNHQLRLNHLDNNFSIGLALLDFKAPRQNRFEYFLENYDKHWRSSGDKNTAYYSQIPPGNYRLRVKGYNADGEYGEATPLQITILPPWWQTWWAIGLYCLAVFGLIYGIYRFQLSRQLAKAETQRLQELDVAKSQLYTNITHEFRTPLTVILGMAKQLHGQLPNSQNLMVEMISRNGQNLLNLVNQMLDLSKLESGQMTLHLQQGDLITYLKYLVESFHSYAETRGVTIHFLSDLEVQYMDFDPGKIQQVISNVLSNAIKFTPTGGNIYLSVDRIKQAQEQLTIRVKDTGVGIAPERLPYIFQRFYQADDSHTKAFAGTGIGLALVFELVKLMGGDISARSELGKGTEILIHLPVANNSQKSTDLSYFDQARNQFYREGVAPQEQERITLGTTDKEKPQILIVEDNYDVRTYICACLSDSFDLLTAENGQRGVEKAMEHVPDFIISDVMMPLKDGYALARELKADKRTSHIPIILLTAKADTDSRLLGLKQGADAYLAKPFNPEELTIRVNQLLELRQKLQQHFLGHSDESSPMIGTETIAQEHHFVQQVKAIIHEHLDDADLDVKTICQQINMSHSQLHRKLSALTGLSINRYIRHLRLERAKELLREPGQTITAVAFDTGYKDPSYFGRVFKKETGMTPAEWQKAG